MLNLTSGQKFDGGDDKPRWDCVPFEVFEGVAKVMGYGAKKYNENPDDPNWPKVENGKHRYFAAMMRHFMQDRNGEILDSESNLEHLDHFLFNAMAYVHFKRKENANN